MLSEFSVKRTYTVFVSVILVLILGVVSFAGMTTDLLPSLELPYVLVVTAYPGGSPEKVEAAVTRPLEAALGTAGGIKSVSSTSRENSSTVYLEFEQGTNMDSAMIELSNRIDLVAGELDDGVGTPMLLKMSPDMLPVMIASVDRDGQDVAGVSELVSSHVQPAFERLDGVAGIESTGLVERQVTVRLSAEKIAALSSRVLAGVDEKLAEARERIDSGWRELESGRRQAADGKAAIQSQKDAGLAQLAAASAEVDAAAAQVNALLSEELTLEAEQKAFALEQEGYEQAVALYRSIEDALSAARQAAQGAVDAVALEQINAVLAEYGLPPISDGGGMAGAYAQVKKAADALGIALPDALSPAADMPGTVDDLLALTPDAFEAFKAQALQAGMAGALSPEQMTQASLARLRDAYVTAQTRLPQLETELNSILLRKEARAAMRPQMESALRQAQEGYAQLESGKMAVIIEVAGGEAVLAGTELQLEQAEAQLRAAQEQFEDARRRAYEKADVEGMLTAEALGMLLMAQNLSMPAGHIAEGGQQYLVKVGDAFSSVEELRDTVLLHVEAGGVGNIRLSDVADVALTDNAGESYARINGNDGIVLSFSKQSTASTAEVSNRIGAAIKVLEAEFPGLHITPLMDQGDYIDMVVGSVLENLLMGGMLAILVLLIFLRDWRPTVIVALSIPFSLLFAITLMYFSGVTLNLISLSGLALGVGMLVDNSIVVIENIYRLRAQGLSPARAAVAGAKQVAGAIFASTLTTICVFLPIVFTQGLSRELFSDMGLTIGYSLIASLIVALTLVPAMGSLLLSRGGERQRRLFDRLVDRYEAALRWSLDHKAPALAGALGLLLFSSVMVTRMGTAFIPATDSPQMSATLTMPSGADRQETFAMADAVMERMSAVEGVRTVGAMEGSVGLSTGFSMGSASGRHRVEFYLLLDEDRTVTNVDVKHAILEAASDLDVELDVTESTMDLSVLGGSGLELVVSGQDLDQMGAIADDLRGILRGIEGLTDISEPSVADTPETRVTIDKAAAMRYGLSVAQIYQQLAAAVKNESQATLLMLDNSSVPVVIMKPETKQLSRAELASYEFTVTNEEGQEETVSLGAIAQITEAESLPSISREGGARVMRVTAGVDDTHNIGLVSREVEKRLRDYTPPTGIAIALTGENESINSAIWDLLKTTALAVIFIYLIMVAQFQSLLSPFIVMFTIPLAFTGGLLALLVTGKELSIIAMLGFLVLAGVVVNNGIVFVDSINQLRLEGACRRAAILETGRVRIRPVLMTALTTILAMSTMAMGLGQGADMTQPMAIVTIGGLTYATLMTLVVVPVLYEVFLRRPLRAVPQADRQ